MKPKKERRLKRDADIRNRFANQVDNRSSLVAELAKQYDITIARVYQIIKTDKFHYFK